MINSIVEAISCSLNEEFGDDYEIHNEEIKQGLKEPCFFIACLNPNNNLFLGKRYERTNQFCIQYFPQSAKKQRECADVAERMHDCLEYITTDGDTKPIRGSKMNHQVVDGVLNFFVNYDFFTVKTEDQTPMETMTASTAKSEQTEPMFSKEQILASARFANRRDLVDALLDEDKSYTIETVDNLVEKYMKGQVK